MTDVSPSLIPTCYQEEDAPKVVQHAEAGTAKQADSEGNESAQATGYDSSVAQHADTEHKEDSSALETSHKTPRDVGGARERAKVRARSVGETAVAENTSTVRLGPQDFCSS